MKFFAESGEVRKCLLNMNPVQSNVPEIISEMDSFQLDDYILRYDRADAGTGYLNIRKTSMISLPLQWVEDVWQQAAEPIIEEEVERQRQEVCGSEEDARDLSASDPFLKAWTAWYEKHPRYREMLMRKDMSNEEFQDYVLKMKIGDPEYPQYLPEDHKPQSIRSRDSFRIELADGFVIQQTDGFENGLDTEDEYMKDIDLPF